MSYYDIDDAVPLVYTISNTATVTLTVTDPDGVVSNPSLTQAGSPPTVTYSGAVLANKAGTWRYRFLAVGTVTDAEPGTFHVRPIPTTNLYAAVHELKSRLTIPTSDVVDDGELEAAIDTASRWIDADCQRHFYRLTEARTFTPCDWYRLELGPFNDLVSVTTLKTDASGDGVFEVTWATADYQLLIADGSPNVNAGPEPRPYQYVRAVGAQLFPLVYGWATRRNLVEITGVWGWPQIPADVRQACLILAAEQVKLKDAPLGAAIGVADLGIIRVRENPQADRLLQPYRRYPKSRDGQPMFAA